MNPLASLRDQITASFNLDELMDLCFELQIDYELLPGDSKRAKVRGLMEYCQRHGRISDLTQRVLRLRPEINFQEIDQHSMGHRYVQLLKILISYFTEDDLKGLVSQLRIEYKALPGNTKREKARELVSYCQQHELINTLKQGIEQAPEGIYFVPRLSTKQAKQTNNTPNIVIPASWPSEIRCRFCKALIRLVDLDDHFANGIELSSEEYDFILEEEEHEQGGNWEVSGLIVCRNCGRENPLIEGHIATHVHENYRCSNCKQTGHMTAHINKIEGWPGTAFARRIRFILTCENCNQHSFRRKLLRSFQNIKSLQIRNTGIRTNRTPRTSKG